MPGDPRETPSATDSAGTPFAGRSVPASGFSGDAGEADAALVAALAAYAVDPGQAPAVAFALSRARLLVPVVAVLAEAEVVDGVAREKATDMALVTILGPAGQRALPVFTSLASLSAWRRDARPVPVEAARAALSAAAEGAEALVVDPGGPVPFAVAGPLLRVLAEGGVEPPLWADLAAEVALSSALSRVPALRGVRLEPAPGADARVVLLVDDGADPAAVASLAAPVLQASALLRRRTFSGLDVAVAPA